MQMSFGDWDYVINLPGGHVVHCIIKPSMELNDMYGTCPTLFVETVLSASTGLGECIHSSLVHALNKSEHHMELTEHNLL